MLPESVLVGRSDDLRRLAAALDRAVQGRPGAVLVGGEAGMGKTRLLEALDGVAEARGARVLTGRCVDLAEAAIPLLPITDALAALQGHGVSLPPELGALLSASEPWKPAPGGLGPQRVLAAAAELLRRLASDTPLVLVVEDLQWADRSTLALLTFVLRRLRDERLLVLGSYRTEDLDRRPELREFLSDVARAGGVERLELRPLTPEEGQTLLEHRGDRGPPSAGRIATILARAEGNPLFIEELAALGSDGAADGLPLTLRDMFLARLHRLDPVTQQVIRVVAAGGRRMPHRLLELTVDLEADVLDEALREAVHHLVLVPAGAGYAFRQALLQEVAYGQLLPGERLALHGRLARALTDHPELTGGNAATVAAAIAHHATRAGDPAHALQASVRAGETADALHTPAEAVQHFTRALALWSTVAEPEPLAGLDRATLAARTAAAAAATGRYGDAIPLVETAIALVDAVAEPVRAGLLHERRGWYLWYDGRSGEAVPAYEEAVRLIPAASASAERAGAIGRLGLLLVLDGRDPAQARTLGEEALAAAREAEARVEEAEAIVTLGLALDPLGDGAGAIACLREAREIGLSSDAPLLQARAAINLSHLLRRSGELREAVDVALDGARLCRLAGLDFAEGGLCLLNAAEAAFELGDWTFAAQITDQQLAKGASRMTRVWALQHRAALSVARGDFESAVAATAEQRELARQVVPERAAETGRITAEMALWDGDPEAALADAGAAAELILASDPLLHDELTALALRAAADVATRARDRQDAVATAAAVQRAGVLREQTHVDGRTGAALRATIEAEHARACGADSPAAWDGAVRAWEARTSPYRAAYARWRQAEALLTTGAPRPAVTDVLRLAHATALALGAAPLQQEIVALARRARIDLDEPEKPSAATGAGEPVADPFRLTPREHEVLEHLALGQTNRQIGAALFISVKTVGTHVAHIFEKLGASTRAEAAAIAHRQDLLQ